MVLSFDNRYLTEDGQAVAQEFLLRRGNTEFRIPVNSQITASEFIKRRL